MWSANHRASTKPPICVYYHHYHWSSSKDLLLFCVHECFVQMYVCVAHKCSARGRKKRASDPWKSYRQLWVSMRGWKLTDRPSSTREVNGRYYPLSSPTISHLLNEYSWSSSKERGPAWWAAEPPPLPFYFLHVVCISVEEVGHRILDGLVLESRSCPEDGHIGDSRA